MAKTKNLSRETGISFILLGLIQLIWAVRYSAVGFWSILEMLACVAGAVFAFMKLKKLATISVAVELVVVFVSFIQLISFEYLSIALFTLAKLFAVVAWVFVMILYASNAMEIKLSKSVLLRLKTLTIVFAVLYLILIVINEIVMFIDIPDIYRHEIFDIFILEILLFIARLSVLMSLQRWIFDRPSTAPKSDATNTVNAGVKTDSLFEDDNIDEGEEKYAEPVATDTFETSVEAELAAYTELFEKGIISKREYEAKKKSLGIK